MHQPPKILFLPVKDNSSKIHLIHRCVHKTIEKSNKMLITVPNEEAAKYMDALLWRLPPDSFLPHAIIQKPTDDWVAITTVTDQNLNLASCLFNLCIHLSPISQQFKEIYEFYDETTAEKSQLTQDKIKAYQAQGLSKHVMILTDHELKQKFS